MVHSEGITGGVFRAKPNEVRMYQEAFASLTRLALDPPSSVEFIVALSQQLGHT